MDFFHSIKPPCGLGMIIAMEKETNALGSERRTPPPACCRATALASECQRSARSEPLSTPALHVCDSNPSWVPCSEEHTQSPQQPAASHYQREKPGPEACACTQHQGLHTSGDGGLTTILHTPRDLASCSPVQREARSQQDSSAPELLLCLVCRTPSRRQHCNNNTPVTAADVSAVAAGGSLSPFHTGHPVRMPCSCWGHWDAESLTLT